MKPRWCLLSAASMATLLLAGCTHAAAPASPAAPTSGTPAATASLALPTWAVGDYWTYDLNGTATTYVVTQDAGQDWFMDTDSPERAFGNARDDVSRLGPQRKTDLAGSQGDERVEYLRFPLQANMSWAARWDHQDVSVRVVSVSGGIANLEAAAGGATIYRYIYDAKVGWFRELHHYAPDGHELIGFTLKASGHGWKGTVVRYTLKSLYSITGNAATGAAMPLQPDAGATDLWVSYHLVCEGGAGGFDFVLLPIDPANAANTPGVGHVASGPCVKVDVEMVAPGPLSVPWALSYSWGAQTITYRVEILQRTRSDIPVGA